MAKRELPPFSVCIIFIVLMLLGAALMPSLSLQMEPSSRSNLLYVDFSWPGANPEMLEMEVTTKLEGAYARTRGLTKISSVTNQDNGYITLEVDKSENIDAIKLYLSSVTRSLEKEFPDGVILGSVSDGEMRSQDIDNEAEHLLLTYVAVGPGTSQDVADFIERCITKKLSDLEGISKISVEGATPFQWILNYDSDLLSELNIQASDIYNAVNNYYMRKEEGRVLFTDFPEKSYAYMIYRGCEDDKLDDIGNISIKNDGGKIVRLADIVSIDYVERKASTYMRINGLNNINVNIYNTNSANIIDLSSKIQRRMRELERDLPEGFSMKMMRDESEDLGDEIQSNLIRTLITVLVLLAFVYLTRRDLRYLGIIAASLLANTLIAMIFYKLFNVEIHIYTLAGIAVSFGLTIDNVIVMADHYSHHRNRKVFMAIIAATLTTTGALLVIFNMDNEVMRKMWGFSAVIIINLLVSIVVALLFVPALLEYFPLRGSHWSSHSKSDSSVVSSTPQSSQSEKHHRRSEHRRLRNIAIFSGLYERYIRYFRRYRWLYITILILAFGIPIFLLPQAIETHGITPTRFAKIYNSTIGGKFFATIRPSLEKYMGGALHLFMTDGGGEGWIPTDTDSQKRTTIIVEMTMPLGATLEQMNDAMMKIENFVAGFDQIESFYTRVQNANRGIMTIRLKREFETGGTAQTLSDEIFSFCNTIGNADCNVVGSGKAFNNITSSSSRERKLKVTGYNYRRVREYAEEVRDALAEYRRVQRLYIGNAYSPDDNKEYALHVDRKLLARNNSNIQNILGVLKNFSKSDDHYSNAYMNGELKQVVLRPTDSENLTLWEFMNTPIRGEDSYFRLADIGEIVEESSFESISKVNQEYEIAVQYDFIGDNSLAHSTGYEVAEMMNKKLPIGFKVSSEGGYITWEKRGGVDERVWYILTVIAIIFVICSTLLESLKQAMLVVLIVPISLIGSFLGFSLFNVDFNEGGLASFILMCGLSVNSILYIFNDYNIRISKGAKPGVHTYTKAYNAKIIPILLTTLSTIVGFIPFLVGDSSPFWKSLATGTISGLIFSIFVLFFVLPIFSLRYDQVSTK